MKKSIIFLLLPVFLLGFYQQTSADGGDSSLVHACINNNSGQVQIVAPDEECNSNWTHIHWGIEGPPGPVDPALLGRISALENQIATLQEQMSTVIYQLTPPEVSINDVEIKEDETPLYFTVSLSKPSNDPITVSYRTYDGSAIGYYSPYSQCLDYCPSGTKSITFDPGETTILIGIAITEDDLPEYDETFTVSISTSDATVVKAEGVGTILNDDIPTASVSGVYWVREGDSLGLTVLLTKPHVLPVSVDIQTSAVTEDIEYFPYAGYASPGADYEEVYQRVTIAPGATWASVNIPVPDDAEPETVEAFMVGISNPENAVLSPTSSNTYVLIELSDIAFDFVNGPATHTEGNNGLTPLTFEVAIPEPFTRDVKFRYLPGTGGTATYAMNRIWDGTQYIWDGDYLLGPDGEYRGCASDYLYGCAAATITAGSLTTTFDVYMVGDIDVESDETFSLDIYQCYGCMPWIQFEPDRTVQGIIINDD